MNHYLATYIDLIQSIGFIVMLTVVVFVLRKLLIDNINDNCIEDVKITVED